MFDKPELTDVRRIFILSAFLPACLLSFAHPNIRIKPEPDWLCPVKTEAGRNPDLKDVSNGYYYELMDRQINLLNQTEYLHFIRHIVNESGVQDASEVSVEFAPQFQQVNFHKVLVFRNGKSVNQLQMSSVKLVDEESNSSGFEYNGIKRAFLILNDVQKGDLIEVSYSVTGFNPVFEGRYSGDFYFSSVTPVANYYLSILAEPGRKIYFKSFNQAPAPSELIVGKLKIYQWKNPVLDNSPASSGVPSWFTPEPYVSVSEYASWKEVVDWGLALFKAYDLPLPADLLHLMDSWRKESNGDADMFANLALRFVQDQIRYLALEIGTYTHQPHTPANVFSLRFGDCKDKALLLATILNHEHIEAYVALTNTGQRENLSRSSPSSTAFDHAIVAIKRSSGYIFVDPTISMQRGELINSYIPAYGWALVIKQGEMELTEVEPGFLHYTSVTETLNAQFADSNTLTVSSKYKGGAADEIRNNLSTVSRKEVSETYTKYYAKLFDGIIMSGPVLTSDDSLRNELTVNESYAIPALWRKNDAGKLRFETYAKLIASKIPDPATHPETEPLSLDFPLTQEYVLSLNMPEEWPVDMTELHIKNDSYQFDFTPLAEGKHLRFTYYFKSFRDFIPGSAIRQFKEDYKEMDKCFNLGFTYNDFTPPAHGTKYNPGPVSDRNWINIWISFFFGVLFTILFGYLNKKSRSLDQRSDAGYPLAGWIVVLGVTLILRFILQAYNFWNEHYYQISVLNRLDQVGGQKLQAVYIFEMVLSLISMAGIGSLLYWFFGRRDIFPSMFVYYAGFFLLAQLLLLIIYHAISMPVSMNVLRENADSQFFRTLVYSAVWISFVLKSENVKQTFIYPYQEI